MRLITYYFSGTGNTKWMIEQFHGMVQESGHESKIVSIETSDALNHNFLINDITYADYIGFATPIYGGNLPPIMSNFIQMFVEVNKKVNSKKPIYIMNTFGYVNGFGPFCAKRLFKNTGLKLISYVNIRLCNNISSPKFKVKQIDAMKMEKRRQKAKENLRKMLEHLLIGKHYITGIGPYLLPNILVRYKSKKAIEDNYKVFQVYLTSCKKCMLCVKNCPTKSIEFIENSFTFLPSCTACMRCYNHCPTYSILFDGKYADPKIYARYHGPEEM